MDNPKKAVINYITTDRSLRGGRDLYNQLPNKNRAFQRNLANWPDNPANVERLCYELCKTVGLAERQFKIFMQKPVVKVVELPTPTEPTPTEPTAPTTKVLLLGYGLDMPYQEAKALAKALALKLEDQKALTIHNALSAAKNALVYNQLQELPAPQKASIKLREQFPFLKEKDCPDVLKLLVSDLITAWENFKENQPLLHQNLTDADAKALVDVVLEDYINNKLAWDELEHYKINGTLLGVHPIFEIITAKEDIAAMNAVDLAKKINNLKINIGKNTTKGNTDLVNRDKELLDFAESVLAKK